MTDAVVYQLAAGICHIFGRPEPPREGGQFAALRGSLERVPDACAGYIYRRARELETMPANLSRFCTLCWEQWKADDPEGAGAPCATCGGSGGWTFFRRAEGAWREFFSPCPECTFLPPRLRARLRNACQTPEQLRARGCLVPPADYPGGAAAFRRDRLEEGKQP